ncbi:MAG: hypothetical protein ABIJ61_07415 [bacterium]
MPDVNNLISWISVILVALVGVLIISGVVPLPRPDWQIGLGLVILCYALIRALLLLRTLVRRGKNP